MINYVFCHGFGFDAGFFARLVPYFKPFPCQQIELGFLANGSKGPYSLTRRAWPAPIGDKLCFIGHSLGFLALCHYYGGVGAPAVFIGLDGFCDFLGYVPELRSQRLRSLIGMERRLLRNSEYELARFYNQCGAADFAPKLTKGAPDLAQLQAGLALMRRPILAFSRPLRLFCSEHDPIVPAAIFANAPSFARPHFIKAHGHGLGWWHADTLYPKILEFAHANLC